MDDKSVDARTWFIEGLKASGRSFQIHHHESPLMERSGERIKVRFEGTTGTLTVWFECGYSRHRWAIHVDRPHFLFCGPLSTETGNDPPDRFWRPRTFFRASSALRWIETIAAYVSKILATGKKPEGA